MPSRIMTSLLKTWQTEMIPAAIIKKKQKNTLYDRQLTETHMTFRESGAAKG